MKQADRDSLDQVIEETKGAATPDSDWDRIENEVLEAAAAGQRPRFDAPPARSSWLPLAAAAAVALLAGGGVVLMGSDDDPVAKPSAGPVQTVPDTIDGASLAVGAPIVAADSARRVQHAGVATWTLAPGGEAKIAVTGRFLTVELEQGWISAEVVESEQAETFAIEAGDVRVAVHGTRFRVERRGDQVMVQVSEGTVGVGHRDDRGQTRRWMLPAPSNGSFALDGSTGEVTGRGEVSSATEAAKRADTPAPSGAPPPSSSAVFDETPPEKELRSAVDRIVAGVSRCFKKHTPPQTGLRVSAETELTIEVHPTGKVAGLVFNPPLAPAVRGCSDGVIGSVSVSKSRAGTTLQRRVTFER